MKKIINFLSCAGLLFFSIGASGASTVSIYSSDSGIAALLDSNGLQYVLVTASGSDSAGAATGGVCIGKAKLISKGDSFSGVLVGSTERFSNSAREVDDGGLAVSINKNVLSVDDGGIGVCGLNVTVSAFYYNLAVASKGYKSNYVQLIEYSHESALARYRKNDLDGALAELRPFVENMDPVWLVEKNSEKILIPVLNDFGFFLEQSGLADEAVKYLEVVVKYEPARAVARLNLADAYWALGKKDLAVNNYLAYRKLIGVSQVGKMPGRVGERLK